MIAPLELLYTSRLKPITASGTAPLSPNLFKIRSLASCLFFK